MLIYEDGGKCYVCLFMVLCIKDDLCLIVELYCICVNYGLGFLGCVFDYMNVNVMVVGVGVEYFNGCSVVVFGDFKCDFVVNMCCYYEYVQGNDLCLIYVLINLQVNCSKMVFELFDLYIVLGIVEEMDEGVIVCGVCMMVMLLIVDEILIFFSMVFKENVDKSCYVMGFGIFINMFGFSFQCCELIDVGCDFEDYFFSSCFDEQDVFVIFDDVLVFWECIFLFYDVELVNKVYVGIDVVLYMVYQVVNFKIVKIEVFLGIVQSIVNVIGSGGFQYVQVKIVEIIIMFEIMKVLEVVVCEQVELNDYGVMIFVCVLLDVVCNYYFVNYVWLFELL